MKITHKVRLVQAFFGAIILSLLMQPIGMMGFSAYIWMAFLPLIIFFAMNADFKKIPAMIIGFACGLVWAIVNGVLGGVLGSVLSPLAVNAVAPMIVVFLILTVHENFLGKTVFGFVPTIFLGLALSMFTVFIAPSNAPQLNQIHLFGFFLYGTFMAVVLAAGGFAVCSMIFGKETTEKVFVGAVE